MSTILQAIFRTSVAAAFICFLVGVLAQTALAQLSGASSGSVTPTPTGYLLGAGDTITLTVLNHPEFSGDFVIPEGGVVVFPQVGNCKLEGLTIVQATAELLRRFDKVLYDPDVTVVLKVGRPQSVSVLGDVQKPTGVPYYPGMRVADAVSAAGGILTELRASDCTVTILRSNGVKEQFAFTAVVDGDASANCVLYPGDTVGVDSGYFAVYVVGQVHLPGLQHLPRGGGLPQALASAGGALDTAALSRVRVTTLQGQDKVYDLVPYLIHGEKANMPTLHSGDLITIPQTTAQFSVMGYVQAPGVFPIPETGDIHLSDAISLAKGQDATRQGSITKVSLVRQVDGKPQSVTYNLDKFYKKADVSENPKIMAGDVVYVPASNHVPGTLSLSILGGIAAFFSIFRP